METDKFTIEFDDINCVTPPRESARVCALPLRALFRRVKGGAVPTGHCLPPLRSPELRRRLAVESMRGLRAAIGVSVWPISKTAPCSISQMWRISASEGRCKAKEPLQFPSPSLSAE